MSCRPLRTTRACASRPGDADREVRLVDGERGRPKRARRACALRGRCAGSRRRPRARNASPPASHRDRHPSSNDSNADSPSRASRCFGIGVRRASGAARRGAASTRRAASRSGPGRRCRRGCSANSRARRTARSSPSWRSGRTCGRGSGHRDRQPEHRLAEHVDLVVDPVGVLRPRIDRRVLRLAEPPEPGRHERLVRAVLRVAPRLRAAGRRRRAR